MRIRAHPGLCEGHGVCARFAPSVYQLDDEGYLDLHLVEVPPELEGAAVLGASVCPAGVITVLHAPSAPSPTEPSPPEPQEVPT